MQGVSDAGCKISQIKSSISKSQNLVTNLDSTSSNKFRHNNSSTLEDNGTSNYKFKYISKPELEAVIKRVRRAKQRKRDEEEWKYFVQLRQEPRDASSWQVCSATGRSNTCVECGLPESTPTSSSSDRGQSQSGEEEISKDSGTVKAAVSVPEIVATTEDVIASHTYQLSPGLLKRLEDLISTVGRMTALLLNPGLCSQLEDEDVDRTIKRSLEFDAMFARNHLYEIQRLLKDTKQLIRSANTIELEAKIVGALKCVTQALQVYMRHVSKGSRIKYQQVVPIFQSITSIEKLLEHLTGRQLFPMRQELEVSCNYLKKLLLETSTTETRSVVSRASHKVPRGHNTRKPSTDLSMYNRRGRDWRRKSAALARQRFGPPLYKKHQRKSGSGSATARGKLDAKLRKDPTLSGTTSQVLSSKSYDKSGLLKEGTNAKDVTFRNATRAVPEEQITTMMEMIPHEPLDESDLCLDDSEFQALKLLNGAQPSIQESKVVDIQPEDDIASGVLNEGSSVEVSPVISVPFCEPGSVVNESSKKISSRSKDGEDNKTNSAKSSARGICNVQLVCLTESSRTDSSHALAQESTTIGRDECTTLNIESTTKSEAEEFKRKMTDYHNSSPHYKDGKATDVVDRLANQILTDMILDFQRDEVDQVIRILYNLEFE
ncbi:uncharacterized protein LOC124367943 isoform X2 [Homalodisca vitripennis]|uniref:uncharacterized protein LOC124367943 isoform X2 n=1 Tax=Homalodisca vitripennis TaxID=197043 RepID=UPI001EEA5064|nr:uncharacterized protein LOC124367943 isoform X2 [Homalodisca vitripennis]